MDSKLSILMKQLDDFYTNIDYIKEIKSIIEQDNILSLRILDWFITNYSKKYRTIIYKGNGEFLDVYMYYKIMLKSFSKSAFDPFCRKNKINFIYTEDDKFLETSCGQLCFFKWCFENEILDFVRRNLSIIEDDMKKSLKIKQEDPTKKRQALSLPASRSIIKQHIKYTVKFD
jgi:hypothetical protein